jgi:hypothetical protein
MPKPAPRKPRGSIGRPKSENPRVHYVTFRVTALELLSLMRKASRSGMTHGEYARSRALRGIARSKPEAQADPIFGEMTREIFHEARRQGVLLNQIAHHCNTHKIPPPREVSELANRLIGLWDKLLATEAPRS